MQARQTLGQLARGGNKFRAVRKSCAVPRTLTDLNNEALFSTPSPRGVHSRHNGKEGRDFVWKSPWNRREKENIRCHVINRVQSFRVHLHFNQSLKRKRKKRPLLFNQSSKKVEEKINIIFSTREVVITHCLIYALVVPILRLIVKFLTMIDRRPCLTFCFTTSLYRCYMAAAPIIGHQSITIYDSRCTFGKAFFYFVISLKIVLNPAVSL